MAESKLDRIIQRSVDQAVKHSRGDARLAAELTAGFVAQASLNDDQAAEFLNVSKGLLRKFRMLGTGPMYFKIGRSKLAMVRYRMADLLTWQDTHRVVTDEGAA